MARRTLNRRELRAEAEAAEARGLSNEPKSRRAPRDCLRSRPCAQARDGPEDANRLGRLRCRWTNGQDV